MSLRLDRVTKEGYYTEWPSSFGSSTLTRILCRRGSSSNMHRTVHDLFLFTPPTSPSLSVVGSSDGGKSLQYGRMHPSVCPAVHSEQFACSLEI